MNCNHFPLTILWHVSTRVVATMFNIAKNKMARVVTKISSCWVNTTSRQGIKQLGVSFGSVFLLYSRS